MRETQNLSQLIDEVLLNFKDFVDERRYMNMEGFSAYVKKPDRYFYRYRKIEALLRLTRKYHKEGDVILDVGCGVGVPLIVAAHFFGNVVGFDVNRNVTSILKRYIDFHKIDAGNLAGSIMRIPVRTMCADIVWCLDVLEHLKDPELAILGVRKVLKPNGYMIISLPVENYLTRVSKKMLKLGARGHYTGSIKTLPEMFRMLRKHFYLVEMETIPDWLPLTFAFSVLAVFLNRKGSRP